MVAIHVGWMQMWQETEAYKRMPLILSVKLNKVISHVFVQISVMEEKYQESNQQKRQKYMKFGFKSQYNLLTRCTAGVTMEMEPEGPGSDHKIHPIRMCSINLINSEVVV